MGPYSLYSLKVLAEQKMAEECQAAARDGLAARADRARRQARQSAGSPLAGVLRALARVLGFHRPVQPAN